MDPSSLNIEKEDIGKRSASMPILINEPDISKLLVLGIIIDDYTRIEPPVGNIVLGLLE